MLEFLLDTVENIVVNGLMIRFAFDRKENILEKNENVEYQHFFSFSSNIV